MKQSAPPRLAPYLLFMEKGSRIDCCLVENKGANYLGMMFVQLPSVILGGKVSVFEDGGELDSNGDEWEKTSANFDHNTCLDSSLLQFFDKEGNDCPECLARI